MSFSVKRPFKQDPSATAAFAALRGALPNVGHARAFRTVVIGGGTGAPVSIKTLLSLGAETSAVVAMADDGGSTGKLRAQANVTPPGDIRKCLIAFAEDPDDALTQAFKYRFEFADNHTLGNLMLSALEQASGSFPQAVRICEGLLHAKGHVYPSTLGNVVLVGETKDGRVIEGQALLSHSRTALERVWLKDPSTAQPYPEAIKAICEADLIVLGPGSLFTSIIPNLLVPGVTEAIRASRGKTLFVCGLADMQGETWGLSAEEHVSALQAHGMTGLLDYVLINTPQPLRPGGYEAGNFASEVEGPTIAGDPHRYSEATGRIRPVSISFDSVRRIQETGPMVITRNLANSQNPTWHDPLALSRAFAEVLKLCRSPQM
ncbi:gluconeogenesis factor YvcK family protein [Cryptobacterium curtum]|uniref:gluconeogenesis factor YvcK family protein n=1 Tax=Cryptobacterium curtum TaxID=84163 RepID=UPI00248D947B|nr:gluconeogenesis factor YvcK family protein [Cryptobacterium curtum]